ncbi:MAG: D-alanine--D-alanine ligase [Chloroflexi bacterium]|nr:D-alanine--D-alanine ligase [Chloroflexota bacterium]
MGKIRIGVVFGGRSGEHEISLQSATSIMNAIDKNKFDVVPIGITKEGKWLLAGDPLKQLLGSTDGSSSLLADPLDNTVGANGRSPLRVCEEDSERDLVPAFSSLPSASASVHLDVVFPVVHGTNGEDGTLQGLLDLADIPYVGAGVLGSAVGMDKVMMKHVFRVHRLPIPDYLLVLRSEWDAKRTSIVATVEKRLGYPCFVKPANLGSSVGISKAHRREEMEQAIDDAAQYDRRLIVEEAIDGARELECAVLGNDKPVASGVGEIVPCNEFYDYEAKYVDDRTTLVIPAEVSAETARQARRLAVRAFKAVDCAGLGRVDFLLRTSDGKLFVNEINTIPGFTSISMYPKLWEQSGVSYSTLIERLVGLAIERFADKRRNKTSYCQ